jgi:hypothetical protein
MSNESIHMRTLLIFCVRLSHPSRGREHLTPHRAQADERNDADYAAIPRSNRTTVSSTRSALNGCPISAEYDAIAMN